MAFPVVAARALARTTASDVSSHPITLPTGIAAGHLLLVVFSVDGNPTISINTGASGNNWTLGTQASNTTIATSVYIWKIAEGSDALTLTTSVAEQSSHVSLRITGAYLVEGISSNGSSTNSDPASLTPTGGAKDYLWIATRGGDSTVVATVAPTNFSNLQSEAAVGTSSASTNTAERTYNASVLNPGTFTSVTEQWVSFTLAVHPTVIGTLCGISSAGGYPEQVVNGSFAAGTDWNLVRATITAGEAVVSTTDAYASVMSQDIPIVYGKTYRVQFDITNFVSGTIRFIFGTTDGGSKNDIDYAANGHYSADVLFDGTGTPPSTLTFYTYDTAGVMHLDNVSVKPVDPESVETVWGTLTVHVPGSITSALTAGISTPSGTLKGKGTLAGTSAGVATASGITLSKGKLGGTASGSSTVSGTPTGKATLIGKSDGISAPSGIIVGFGRMIAQAAGIAVISGTLNNATIPQSALNGRSDGIAIVSGTLNARGILAGQSNGLASALGTLNAKGILSGRIDGSTSASASLKAKGILAGQSAGTASGSITITPKGKLAGRSDGVASVIGHIRSLGRLEGASHGLAALVGTCTNQSFGVTYYVSPSGNDGSGLGTLASPWKTLNKAWTVVNFGDTVYMRGGTYQYLSQQYLTGKNGIPGKLIKIFNYPGESPVITRATTWTTGGYKAGVFFVGNYIHFRGIKITGFDQRDDSVWCAMRCEDFNYNVFERMDFSWSGLGSYMTSMNGSCTGNLFLNSDWHDNYDPITNYENADGINFENVNAGGTNSFVGCRAWNNSDDGFDFYGNDSFLLMDNCWAWGNGFQEDQATMGGDGSGFKMGGANGALSSILARVQNCISFNNAAWGFNENGSPHNMEVLNNTSFGNNITNDWGGGFHFNKPGVAYTIKNNLSYDDDTSNDLGTLTNVDHNSWDLGITVLDSDFKTLDTTNTDGIRQIDGSLPVLNFLKLNAGVDVINVGVNVGLPFSGTAPDLGAYEYALNTVSTIHGSASGIALVHGTMHDGNASPGAMSGIAAGTSSAYASCSNQGSNVYYVKVGGNDSLPGTSSVNAWATISKVNAAWLAGTFNPGDQILFNRGDLFYGRLIVGQSGTVGLPVTVGAYGSGVRPIITGFTAIASGWTSYGSGVYYKTVSCESAPNLVLVNNKNTPMGRYPKKDIYNTSDSVSGSYVTDSALPSSPNFTGGDVVFMPVPWWIYRLKISSHSGTTLNFDGSDMDLNGSYFIQNHINALLVNGTVAGEWFYDPSTSRFYMYNGATAPGSVVEIPTLDNLVTVSGKGYVTFDNITFKGANNSLSELTNSSYITFQNCDLKCIANILMVTNAGGTSHHNTVTYCTIDEINNNLLRVPSDWNYVTFTHNAISNVGTIEGAAPIGRDDYYYSGIFTNAPNTVIEYNSFKNVGYVPVLFEQGASGTIIRRNFFDKFCYVKSDGGAIYSWVPPGGSGVTTPVEIRNNIIMNGTGARNFGGTADSQAYGIYMDDRVKNVIIDGNTVFNVNGYCAFLHNASYITVTNNTLVLLNRVASYGGYNTPLRIRQNVSDGGAGVTCNHITQTGNKVISCDEYVQCADLTNNEGTGVSSFFTTLNNNYYAKPNINDLSAYYLVTDNGGEVHRTLADWKSYLGKDTNSLGSPLSSPLASADDVHVTYNASEVNKNFTLSTSMKDVTGANYSGTITIAPYTSVVLFGAGTVTEDVVTTITIQIHGQASGTSAASGTIRRADVLTIAHIGGTAAGTSTACLLGTITKGHIGGHADGTGTASGTLSSVNLKASGVAAGTSSARGTLILRASISGLASGKAVNYGTFNPNGFRMQMTGLAAGVSNIPDATLHLKAVTKGRKSNRQVKYSSSPEVPTVNSGFLHTASSYVTAIQYYFVRSKGKLIK